MLSRLIAAGPAVGADDLWLIGCTGKDGGREPASRQGVIRGGIFVAKKP